MNGFQKIGKIFSQGLINTKIVCESMMLDGKPFR